MAANVVSSKYFRGGITSKERESSVRSLISRVTDAIAKWGREDGYFETDAQQETFHAELTALLVNQYAAFNSPVWFNVGVEEKPQCSACFILSVDDNMESLLDLQKQEAMLFKYGSGAGSNFSNIRSSKEAVKGGGYASGPVSFLRGYDSWAGTIKSGGKTRRAAKMQILNVEHPDINEFIAAKQTEEQKAWALIEQGYDGSFNAPGGAYESVFFQNSNFSVRVTDEFMEAAENDKEFYTRKVATGEQCEKLSAKKVLEDISRGTWICGDPGIQFDNRINEWHTCPNSGRINASNPCSEYMHVDDSACNLASINLLKFLREDGTFEIEKFKHAVDLLITAQDIFIDRASYPTEKIASNASRFRQLGLGFANLGALLMSKGLAYDSEEGQALAAAIMAVLTGQAYLMSSQLAEHLGAFEEYDKNSLEMLGVMKMHSDAVAKVPRIFSTESLCEEATKIWDEVLSRGREFGFKNSQATVLAPTGTIAFLMDCDTTGIEPDIALVKYKKLVGGGMLKIVNNTVSRGLKCLGYADSQIEAIKKYVDEFDTIEGAPGLKDEHLPVFDCAFKPLNGKRSINWNGHLRMMAAVQPFVSGAISKTVNLPEAATVEQIFDTYLNAWKLGLKAVAIYRDNSKRSQPLGTSVKGHLGKGQDEAQASALTSADFRRRLPDERNAITHKFNIGGHEGYVTVGLFEDGTPGEIFMVMAKEGSTLSGIMDAFATSISIALQYGVPLSALVKKFSHMRFEPAGMTSNKEIPFAKSVTDYIFRWLALKFLTEDEQKKAGLLAATAAKTNGSVSMEGQKANGVAKEFTAFTLSDDAPPCSACGSSLMVRQGSCYRCLNCGSQGGCG
jgi:ribonucleoside-diphosphate reductase alpha chain